MEVPFSNASETPQTSKIGHQLTSFLFRRTVDAICGISSSSVPITFE